LGWLGWQLDVFVFAGYMHSAQELALMLRAVGLM